MQNNSILRVRIPSAPQKLDELNEAKDIIQKKACAALKKAGYNGLVILPTGLGKGKIMIDACLDIGSKKILYLCNTELARDKVFKDELRKWNCAYLIDYVHFMCYQTACRRTDLKYDILLADEFDSALTPEYIKAITHNTYKYKILVSATLEDAKKRKAVKIAPIVYEQKIREVIEAGALNKQKFYYVNYDLSAAENRKYLEFNTQFTYLLNLPKSKETELRLNKLKIFRKQFLAKLTTSVTVAQWLLKKLDTPQNKILIFTGLSEQADRIAPPYSFHSKNDVKGLAWFNAFNAGKINKIVVVNKVDRALNMVGVNNIIFVSTDSSKTKMTQRGGRGMRLDVDDTLNLWFLIPYYRTARGERKPTIVQSWIVKGTVDNDTSNITNINFN